MIKLKHNHHGEIQFENYKEFSNWCKVHGYKVSHMYHNGVDGWTRITKRKAKVEAPVEDHTVTYASIKKSDAYHEDKASCSVVSMAVALQISFEKAQAYLRDSGRKQNKGASMSSIKHAYKQAGYRMSRLWRDGDDGKMITAAGMTVAQICREYTDGTYVVVVNGHILTIVDGVPQDWVKSNSRRKCHNVYRINPLIG